MIHFSRAQNCKSTYGPIRTEYGNLITIKMKPLFLDHLKTIGAKTSNSSSDRTLIKTLFN